MSHYFHARLPDQFDAVLHFDETRAVEPLGAHAEWEAGRGAGDVPVRRLRLEPWRVTRRAGRSRSTRKPMRSGQVALEERRVRRPGGPVRSRAT